MKPHTIEKIKSLKGGLTIETLEKALSQLLAYLSQVDTDWEIGIELINDLIHLKKHDGSTLSSEISSLTLKWINQKYDQTRFEGFSGDFHDDDTDAIRLVNLMDLTLDTLLKIRHQIDILYFLQKKLHSSNSSFESFCLEEIKDFIKIEKTFSKVIINDSIRDDVLQKADEYFEKIYESKEESFLFCGLRETIRENDFCFTLDWCIKSEKYISSVKRTKLAGGGPLMISKITDDIQMAGSAPGIDWINEFELQIRGLEAYWCLVIQYDKSQIAPLKTLLQLSTPGLLQLVNQNSLIQIEKEIYELKDLENNLKKAGVDCKLELRERQKPSTSNL